MTRRLRPLPRVRRDPKALKQLITRKRAARQSTAREQREFEIAVAAVIRREVKQSSARS